MAIGGYAGRDTVLSVKRLQTMVNEGQVRYFLIPSSSAKLLPTHDLDQWIVLNGKAVPPELWENEFNRLKMNLYECRPER